MTPDEIGLTYFYLCFEKHSDFKVTSVFSSPILFLLTISTYFLYLPLTHVALRFNRAGALENTLMSLPQVFSYVSLCNV